MPSQSCIPKENGLKICLFREWLKALSSGRMAQSSVSQRPEQMNWVFPSSTEKRPCQDHIASQTIALTWSSVPWENTSKLCLPQDLNKWAQSSPLSLTYFLFKIILLLKLLYQVKAASPRRMAKSSVFWENGSKLCLPKTWTNELSPPQYHWEMAFSRSPCY